MHGFRLVPHWQLLVQNMPAPLQGHFDFHWKVALQLQDGRSFRANMHDNSLSLLCISLIVTSLSLVSESTELDSECERGDKGYWTREIGNAAILR